MNRTSLDELYDTYGALMLQVTGRQWWRKPGIQARPKSPYATIFFSQLEAYEKQIVENIESTGTKPYTQIPWGTSQIQAQFEFYGDRTGNTATQAAHRFVSALSLEERYWDIWQISALAGRVSSYDLSLAFREDIEPRVELRMMLIANITDPLPLPDADIWDIHSQEVDVIHVGIDNVETTIAVIKQDDES